MAVTMIESLNQKFALKNYSVYFNVANALLAEELLDHLDRASGTLKQVFNSEQDLSGSFYILPALQDLSQVSKTAARASDGMHIDYEAESVLIPAEGLKVPIGTLAVRGLGLMYFNNKVSEKELGARRWRSPSWLRDGFALQAEYKVGLNSAKWLQSGWAELKEAQKDNKLIKPAAFVRDVQQMSDAKQKQSALFQAFYMVRLLLGTYLDTFFAKYSTLMSTLKDMEAEYCFRRITGFDFEKFFAMFASWVAQTNAYTAME